MIAEVSSACTLVLLSCVNLSKPLNTAKHLSEKQASRYNVAINQAAQKYDVSPYLMLGIFAVESNLGAYSGVSKTNDYGPMQINVQWFSKLGMKPKKVKTPEGGMMAAAKLLSLKKAETKGEGCWWSIYNSHTPRFRRIYEAKVKRALLRYGGHKVSCKRSDFLDGYDKALAYARGRGEAEYKDTKRRIAADKP